MLLLLPSAGTPVQVAEKRGRAMEMEEYINGSEEPGILMLR